MRVLKGDGAEWEGKLKGEKKYCVFLYIILIMFVLN